MLNGWAIRLWVFCVLSITSAYHNRGHAKSTLGDFEAAISDYDEVIRIAPNNAIARINRENARKELKERQKAT